MYIKSVCIQACIPFWSLSQSNSCWLNSSTWFSSFSQRAFFVCVLTGFPVSYCCCKAGDFSPTAFQSPSIPCLVQHWQYRQYRHFLETKSGVSGFLWTHVVSAHKQCCSQVRQSPFIVLCREWGGEWDDFHTAAGFCSAQQGPWKHPHQQWFPRGSLHMP